MEKRIKEILYILFVIAFIVSLALNVVHYSYNKEQDVRDTIRETYVDTIPFFKPVPRDSIVVRTVTERLPTVPKFPGNVSIPPESVPEFPENALKFSKPVSTDSADVVIPITQKIYKDSLYTAYVSGYKPNLDSIVVLSSREVMTLKEHPKMKRWNIGIQAGYGVTLNGTPKFIPYIGVGISYNLFNF